MNNWLTLNNEYFFFEMLPNFSEGFLVFILGSVIHPYEATLSLAEKDKPDLIIAEGFSVGATIVAEKYNIPMLFQYTRGISHISTWTESPKGKISIGSRQYFDPETTPQLALRFIAAASFSREILMCWHYCKSGKQVFDKLRQELNLGEPFDSYEHILSSYPSFTTVGEIPLVWDCFVVFLGSIFVWDCFVWE